MRRNRTMAKVGPQEANEPAVRQHGIFVLLHDLSDVTVCIAKLLLKLMPGVRNSSHISILGDLDIIDQTQDAHNASQLDARKPSICDHAHESN
jgi:hypothetical protein